MRYVVLVKALGSASLIWHGTPFSLRGAAHSWGGILRLQKHLLVRLESTVTIYKRLATVVGGEFVAYAAVCWFQW